jgi:hypothetical protein
MSLAVIIKTFQTSLEKTKSTTEENQGNKKFVQKVSSTLLNEIEMSSKLKPYSNNFSVIQECNKIIYQNKNNKERVLDSHMLIAKKDVRESQYLQTMWQFFPTNWQLLWYRQLLASLEILNTLKLCYFHWTPQSIFIDKVTEKAMIQEFQHTFSLDNVDFEFTVENSWLPEWKLVQYMRDNKLTILSFSDLCLLGEEFEKSAFMKSLTNERLDNILSKIKTWRETWDLYCMNALLLSLPITLPPFLSKLCVNYTLMDPNKRENIKSFICLYDAELKNYLVSASRS